MAPLLHHVKVPFLGSGPAESFPNLHAVMVVVRNDLLNRDYRAGVINGDSAGKLSPLSNLRCSVQHGLALKNDHTQAGGPFISLLT